MKLVFWYTQYKQDNVLFYINQLTSSTDFYLFFLIIITSLKGLIIVRTFLTLTTHTVPETQRPWSGSAMIWYLWHKISNTHS